MDNNKDIININMAINLQISTDKVPYISYPSWGEPEIFRVNSSSNALIMSINMENMDINMDINKDIININMNININTSKVS